MSLRQHLPYVVEASKTGNTVIWSSYVSNEITTRLSILRALAVACDPPRHLKDSFDTEVERIMVLVRSLMPADEGEEEDLDALAKQKGYDEGYQAGYEDGTEDYE